MWNQKIANTLMTPSHQWGITISQAQVQFSKCIMIFSESSVSSTQKLKENEA